ncbi:MAG: hypothetical protein U0175_39710 [Caldilineaceae bacterium]
MSSEIILKRLRVFLLGLATFLSIGTIAELAFTKHWDSPLQLIPFVLCGLGLIALGLFYFKPMRRNVTILRWVMILNFVGSLFGVFEHVEENVNFALEIKPSTAGLDLVLKGLGGANPLLAPGMLALAALLALAATYYHPILQSE